MDVLQQGIVTLIRSGLTGEKRTLPEAFDLEQAYPRIVHHQIQPICYLGAVSCGVDKQLPVMQQLFRGYCRCLVHNEGQMAVVQRVCAGFDEGGIDYMLLKGCNLKRLYPQPELRLMADADILIRMDQYDRIRPILLELGLQEDRESDHELIWSNAALQLELHKRLIPSGNRDYFRYFGDGWDLANIQNGNQYSMTPEDEYIYLFTHFAKHYRDGGIGFRHAVDLWVYRKAKALDETYIAAELKKLHLLEFEQNVRRMLAVWFEDAEPDEKSRFITNVIFGSGAWGQHLNHILAATARESKDTNNLFAARVKRLWKLTFLPYWQMKQKYPVLVRWPVLLPVFWVVRAVDILVFTKGKMQRHGREFLYTSAKNTETYQRALNYVGLDFHFKEDVS